MTRQKINPYLQPPQFLSTSTNMTCETDHSEIPNNLPPFGCQKTNVVNHGIEYLPTSTGFARRISEPSTVRLAVSYDLKALALTPHHEYDWISDQLYTWMMIWGDKNKHQFLYIDSKKKSTTGTCCFLQLLIIP